MLPDFGRYSQSGWASSAASLFGDAHTAVYPGAQSCRWSRTCLAIHQIGVTACEQ